MIKLINKEVRFDTDTFAPIVRLTVDIALEKTIDSAALMDENEIKLIIGSALFEGLKNGV